VSWSLRLGLVATEADWLPRVVPIRHSARKVRPRITEPLPPLQQAL